MVDEKLEDLQAVSQHVLTSSEKIAELEEAKRALTPGSHEFRELSDRIEALAAEMRVVSHEETNIASQLEGVDGLPTVEEADAAAG